MDGTELLAEQSSWWLLAGGLALMATILVRRVIRLSRRGKRGPSARQTVAEVRSELDRYEPRVSSPLLDAPPEVSRWHAEIEQVQREARAEIDTKIRLLQAVIRQADGVLDRWERLKAEGLKAEGVGFPVGASESGGGESSPESVGGGEAGVLGDLQRLRDHVREAADAGVAGGRRASVSEK